MITVKNLKKNFGDLTVLKGIDVTIEKGECVVVIGPSGSGKSTFLRCLNRLEEPDGGEIDIEGTDLLSPHTDINEMRQRIGMVFQHFNLFPHKTILENVTLAPIKLKKMPQKEAEDAALTEKVFDLFLGNNLAGRKDFIAQFGDQYIEMTDIS